MKQNITHEVANDSQHDFGGSYRVWDPERE
jgi:hypothetical protein